MPVDADVAGLLEQLAAENEGAPPLSETTPDMLRAAFDPLVALQGEPEDAQVEDREVPGPAGPVPIRIYRPAGGAPASGPGVVYVHGGGWVIMDLDSHDPLCRVLANGLGGTVVAVNYRRAPEAPFPAPLDDCWAVLQWVAAEKAALSIGSGRLAVAGDSAGGNLAAALAIKARDNNGPAIAAQVLHVPVTNHDYTTPSYAENADGYLLTKELMEWFWGHYLADEADGANPLASPLRVDNLAGLPPALVQTAEFDPLRDEGAAYAQRLSDAGVPTQHTNIPGMIHDPFVFFGVFPKARAVVDDAVDFLRQHLA
jgi:acetyl esterase